MNEFLNPLDSIQKMDAPPYLLTRIHQRIKHKAGNQLSTKTIWALSLSFLLLIFMNIIVVSFSLKHQDISKIDISSQMHLIPENSFY